MITPSLRLVGGISLAVLAVLAVNRFLLHDRLTDAAVLVIRQPASFLVARSSLLRNIASEYRHIRTLAAENAKLREENTALLARIGHQEALIKENQFLQTSLKLSSRILPPKILAGIFSYHLGMPGYEVRINKGSDQGVHQGQIVISEKGVLIGRIQQVFSQYARVQVITDPSVEIAARVLDKDTQGIAKGDLDRGLMLNLIVQEESVTEGDTVISSGNDLYPPGLVIGRVSHVESNESEVFKKIRIEPALDRVLLGSVLILDPR